MTSRSDDLRLTRELAAERNPGADPDLRTRDVRNLPDRGKSPGGTAIPT
jgi:hypothetical protein